jgi:hypothetical protein
MNDVSLTEDLVYVMSLILSILIPTQRRGHKMLSTQVIKTKILFIQNDFITYK